MVNAASAGQLRFRVRFDKPVSTEDPAGGSTQAFVEQFTRWADIRPMRGGEGVQAQRLQGTQPVLIIVRRDSSTTQINETWRAVEMLNGAEVRAYAVKTAEDMERSRTFLTLVAIAGAADL